MLPNIIDKMNLSQEEKATLLLLGEQAPARDRTATVPYALLENKLVAVKCYRDDETGLAGFYFVRTADGDAVAAYIGNDFVDGDEGARQTALAGYGQITLGRIIEKCKTIARLYPEFDPQVYFQVGSVVPMEFQSWRGHYAELALCYGDSQPAPKLSEFLAQCEDAIGKQFTGYKGGEYTMSETTPVWVANGGWSGNTGVVDVIYHDGVVYIKTGCCDI